MLTAMTAWLPDTTSAEPGAEDRALVQDAVAGDVTAFERLYRRHAGRVHGVISRLVGRHGDRAEDLTQEAFVRAWQQLPSFRHESAFSTWLHRLAVNTALMELRSRRSRPQEESDELLEFHEVGGSGSDSHHSPALKMDLGRAVASLPPRARAVLVLFDIEGWTHEEISASLGMAVGSSKAQLHRARQLLRTRLGDTP